MCDRQKLINKHLQTMTLDSFNDRNQNTWVREVTDPYLPGHRNPFIGNGLIGMRIPMEGNPSVYPEFAEPKMAATGTMMHGIYNENGSIPALNFMGLKIMHGRMVFRRDSGAVINYKQSLDFKNGTVTTECDWAHWGGNLHIKSRIFLSRSQKHVGCLEIELTSDYTTTYVLYDDVDGSAIPEMSDVSFHLRTESAAPKVMTAKIGNIKLSAATVLSINGSIEAGHTSTSAKGFSRYLYCPIQKGETVIVRKCGALYTNEQSNDPVNSAATAAVYALQNFERIEKQHNAAWAKIWEHRIEAEHAGVQALANSALFQLYSCLDETGNGGVPGPAGLSANAWFCHIFHDADTWTFPPASLLNPGMAKNYVQYRVATLEGAKRNAAAMGLKGARYPWEGGYSGDELIPGLVYCEQIHINYDVVQALWRYYLNSGDESVLPEIAEVIAECANFFVDRAIYNAEKDRYELHNVCCPDEFHNNVNNNAFTNYGAVFVMKLADKLAKKLNKTVNPDWLKVAEKMFIPIDHDKKIIMEYEGYDDSTIKQADAVLCLYPMNVDIPLEYQKNTNHYYIPLYEKQKIMMSSAIHGTIAARLGEIEHSYEMFLDLLPHIRTNYLLASESPMNETISLLTGLCGMLQQILMGWAGINITEEELKINPAVPRQVGYLNVLGLYYKGKCYDLKIKDGKYELTEKTA
ncbi:MAG: glycoside hydrolase family 65 protein [Lentisphaeria bacterium]|nr:glycoside hydrolase family 65 protein [Lentisphaeria bacterium]